MARRMVFIRSVVGAAALLTALAAAAPAGDQDGSDRIGQRAPALDGLEWLQGEPRAPESLQGRVLLVRWWTGPGCPYCRASAPYLNAWHERYAERGLEIVGVYHHKSSTPLTRDHVERLVDRLAFRFPIAIDPSWRVLERWWLDGHDRQYTSVSFLIDREGVIRRVHRGGAYSESEAEAIEADIKMMLASPPA